MREFIVLETSEILTETQVRQRYGTRTSLPAILDAPTQQYLGIAVLLNAPKPEKTALQMYVAGEITQDALGNYIRQWHVADKYATEEERVAATLQLMQEQYVRVRESIISEVFEALEDLVRAHGYFSVISLATYVASTNDTWRREAQHIIKLRDDILQVLYNVETAVIRGERVMPTSYNDIKAELPPIVWLDAVV